MTNMSIQPLWLTHFIEILLVLEFQVTKFIVGVFSYKAHFGPQISSNDIWPWKELNPLTMSEWPSPYIWQWKELNPLTMLEWLSVPDWGFLVTNQVPPFSQRMAISPYIWPWEGPAYPHVRMSQLLHLTMEGTNPLTMSKWLSVPD